MDLMTAFQKKRQKQALEIGLSRRVSDKDAEQLEKLESETAEPSELEEHQADAEVDSQKSIPTTTADDPTEEAAFLLACAYKWLTGVNMSERKHVMFEAPVAFSELTKLGIMEDIPDKAEWTTWNRLHGSALGHFCMSELNSEAYRGILAGVMNQRTKIFTKKRKRINLLIVLS
jgi:hypothetical protein